MNLSVFVLCMQAALHHLGNQTHNTWFEAIATSGQHYKAPVMSAYDWNSREHLKIFIAQLKVNPAPYLTGFLEWLQDVLHCSMPY
ncbi:hypothetical protein EDD18DRAFT_1355762 [Armillaria luteobubalina]|uniref:Uncharacterized protein n=1 Tax=Armillaria luteobubalina TaxID=153913 RepID=A0AA39Q2A9_9AGAR|nr:hypothetical protein EDD18DRAFT_1355762 [Armillaria luteobubalina]